MGSQKPIPIRRSNRLPGYDYTLAGAYFVTIVTQKRTPLFGDVVINKMVLNDIGQMVDEEWKNIPERYPKIELDQCIVMPNHLHGIIFINETAVGADLVSARVVPARNVPSNRIKRTGTSPAPTGNNPNLGDIMRAFKSISTNRYIAGVKNSGWDPFDRRIWQRNYHDRIIRNEKELNRIREYVAANPAMWLDDEENPRNIKM